MRVSLNRLARQELRDATDYYQAQNPTLASDFADEIRRCVQSIRAHPRAAPLLRDPIRRKLAERFPYAIFYELRPGVIRILAIAHAKRKPFYWLGRE